MLFATLGVRKWTIKIAILDELGRDAGAAIGILEFIVIGYKDGIWHFNVDRTTNPL